MSEHNTEKKKTSSVQAALEHLTGPARGTTVWFSDNALDMSLQDDRLICITAPEGVDAKPNVIARLHQSENSYEIESLADHSLWVNGEKTNSRRLEDQDLLEFGDAGPLSRYKLPDDGDHVRKSLGDIIKDCMDYTRVSRKPLPQRFANAFQAVFRDVIKRTTVLFRLVVLVSIIGLAITMIHQKRLQEQVANEALRIESFASALNRAQREAIQTSDLTALRKEITHDLTRANERLEALEQRTEASARVIAKASQSIVFLQGAYGFYDTESDLMLRYIVDESGNPLLSGLGQPILTLEGDGPVAERQFTGTAFVVSDSGALLTNRHVALPWEDDTMLTSMREQGLEPKLINFVGYLPDTSRSFTVSLLKVSNEADLAVLVCGNLTGSIPRLKLVNEPADPGDEVIVMGYPTGLRLMLAQTGDQFVDKLRIDGELNFWKVAERLAKENFIRPLSSRGIIGQVSQATIVYDAETTNGGSGGPVLDVNGNVVAVNTAIIPGFGGSNIGIPVAYVHRLLESANIEI